ncbi:MAG: DUF1329 domain-containing protein, partial [Pseudomonadota bacterium]
MYRRGLLTAAVALSLGLGMTTLNTQTVLAADVQFTDADLGGALTPTGAIRAGNEDGSIPEWTGGVTTPPAGYTPGAHHVAPFEADEPLFVITADNADEYRDMLTAGHYQ